jgi:hypothetical protein
MRSDLLRQYFTADLGRLLQSHGFVFVAGHAVAASACGTDRKTEAVLRDLRRHWFSLPVDPYLPDGATYRFRRYGRWLHDGKRKELTYHGSIPYRQSSSVNPLAGGVGRIFAPLTVDLVQNQVMLRLVRMDVAIAEELMSARFWQIDTHVIRIATTPGNPGFPVPEGIHRDGLDVGAVHLIDRKYVLGGISSLYDAEGGLLGQAELCDPLDTLVMDDRALFHNTGPITALDGSTRGWRDVLLVGLTAGTE